MISREDFCIDGLRFVMTCIACPEQYDVFDSSGKQGGYVRSRYGEVRCDFPECGGKTIYEAFPEGIRGDCFETDEDRTYHLKEIVRRIKEKVVKV
jgi:hypothetical protein